MPWTVLSDPVARRYVAGVAWHCYEGDVPAQSQVHDAFPDKDTWFTECSGGEWSPKFAETLGWMTDKLIIGGANNWSRGVLLWNLALDPAHGPHKGGCADCRGVVTIDPATGAITRNVEYYVLGHASRFVLPRRLPRRRDASATASKPPRSSTATEAESRSCIATSGDGPVTIAIDGSDIVVPLADRLGGDACAGADEAAGDTLRQSSGGRFSPSPRSRACSSPGVSSPRTTIR